MKGGCAPSGECTQGGLPPELGLHSGWVLPPGGSAFRGMGRTPPARELGKRPRLLIGLGSILTGGNNFYHPQ